MCFGWLSSLFQNKNKEDNSGPSDVHTQQSSAVKTSPQTQPRPTENTNANALQSSSKASGAGTQEVSAKIVPAKIQPQRSPSPSSTNLLNTTQTPIPQNSATQPSNYSPLSPQNATSVESGNGDPPPPQPVIATPLSSVPVHSMNPLRGYHHQDNPPIPPLARQNSSGNILSRSQPVATQDNPILQEEPLAPIHPFEDINRNAAPTESRSTNNQTPPPLSPPLSTPSMNPTLDRRYLNIPPNHPPVLRQHSSTNNYFMPPPTTLDGPTFEEGPLAPVPPSGTVASVGSDHSANLPPSPSSTTNASTRLPMPTMVPPPPNPSDYCGGLFPSSSTLSSSNLSPNLSSVPTNSEYPIDRSTSEWFNRPNIDGDVHVTVNQVSATISNDCASSKFISVENNTEVCVSSSVTTLRTARLEEINGQHSRHCPP
jgi:hypothetical protein